MELDEQTKQVLENGNFTLNDIDTIQKFFLMIKEQKDISKQEIIKKIEFILDNIILTDWIFSIYNPFIMYIAEHEIYLNIIFDNPKRFALSYKNTSNSSIINSKYVNLANITEEMLILGLKKNHINYDYFRRIIEHNYPNKMMISDKFMNKIINFCNSGQINIKNVEYIFENYILNINNLDFCVGLFCNAKITNDYIKYYKLHIISFLQYCIMYKNQFSQFNQTIADYNIELSHEFQSLYDNMILFYTDLTNIKNNLTEENSIKWIKDGVKLFETSNLLNKSDLNEIKCNTNNDNTTNDQLPLIEYYENGIKKSEKYYKGDKLHRENDLPAFIRYFENQKIMYESYYIKGKRHRDNNLPAIIEYNENNTLKYKQYYKNNVLVRQTK